MAGKDKAAPKLNRRGEMTVPLDGELGLRPDFQAIDAIEEQLEDCSSLLAKANAGTLTNKEARIITTELLRGYGRGHPDDPRIEVYRNAKPDRIGELIHEVGILRVSPRLALILLGVVTGGYTASGEAKTPPAKEGSTADGE